jgi:membrane dipeptidase
MNPYDFGLTEEQQNHAKKLHEENIVIDMLFQGPIGTYALPEGMEEELLTLAQKEYPYDEVAQVRFAGRLIRKWYTNGKLEHLYKECWYESGITAGCRQLSITDKDSLFNSMVDIQCEFDFKPWLIKARSADEIEYAHKNGLKAGIVTSQETVGYGKDLGLLEMAYDFGLRVQQLSYNNHNFVGAGCMEPNDAGLSRFGIEFVEKCNELGIVVDTGHCGHQTTLDACKYSKAPVVATHTGADRVYSHNRCKSDEELKAIASTGGVVGIFAMPWFIAENPQNTTVEHFLDHIDYVVELVGVDHVGIGTDWPMPQTKWMALAFKKHVAPTIGFKKGDGPSIEYVHGIKDYRDFSNVTAGLLSRGYSDDDIVKIIGGNWMRVLREICH